MNQHSNYSIKVDQFEGPFDLLLFFIERDEMDIYNIQITKIINDFLDFIHQEEKLNIELSSEFILFVSTLMRIKAKLLLPRKELDASGNEIDPRQELIDKILELSATHVVGVKHVSEKEDYFRGHFPGNPILPGVVMLSIVKQAVKRSLGFDVQLASASNLKYLAFINPMATPSIFLNLELEQLEDDIKVNATLFFEDTIFFKMKGSYIQRK